MSGLRRARVLVVTAVEAERAAFESGLSGLSDELRAACTVMAGGVGAAAVAAATAEALARAEGAGVSADAGTGVSADAGTEVGARYDVVVSAGIGGAFPQAARLGDLLVAERIVAADLGAETADGFLSVEELGFGTAAFAAAALDSLKFGAGIEREVVRGDVLTVNTATGSSESADRLRTRYPAAIGEAMEGYGVAAAAARFGLPVAEVRAVSNLIGPRDRSAWRIGEALATLTAAAAPIVEGLAQ